MRSRLEPMKKVARMRFVCSDMWKPYLQVIAAQAGQALHVLDRFRPNGLAVNRPIA
jgi:transposase